MSGLTHYYFLPWLRQGISTVITQNPSGKKRASIKVELKMKAVGDLSPEEQPIISKDIEIYGPGDILGFDASIKSRTDPLKYVGDFEPNYFPSIEFAEPDKIYYYDGCRLEELNFGNIEDYIQQKVGLFMSVTVGPQHRLYSKVQDLREKLALKQKAAVQKKSSKSY